MPIQLTSADIPRRKSANGGEGGPLVLPPGAQHISGRKKCETCGRMVGTDRKYPRKGTCKCLYYKRTTTFIDVLQDEFLLKQWGKRNVAYGMSQRPELVLHAASCRPDSDKNQTMEDKRDLNSIAKQADEAAQHMKRATIGTSLHKLTHRMDRGEELGAVPPDWEPDLRAYEQTIKAEGIEWVSIESFRVLDEWVKNISQCNHKPRRYGGDCECMGVAGTVDRIGWYHGRLRIFDIKTGSDFDKLGKAMQLAAYAHMVPYEFPGDTRGRDAAQVDLDVGHIIWLPEGSGECRLEAYDLQMGWRACQLAKQVWDARDWSPVVERDMKLELAEIVSRASSLAELKILWKNGLELGCLDDQGKGWIMNRVNELKAKGVTK